MERVSLTDVIQEDDVREVFTSLRNFGGVVTRLAAGSRFHSDPVTRMRIIRDELLIRKDQMTIDDELSRFGATEPGPNPQFLNMTVNVRESPHGPLVRNQ